MQKVARRDRRSNQMEDALFANTNFDPQVKHKIFLGMQELMSSFPSFEPSTHIYEGRQTVFMKGVIAANNAADLFVNIYIPDNFPHQQPVVAIIPSAGSHIANFRNVDQKGYVKLEGIFQWIPMQSTLCELVQALTDFFSSNTQIPDTPSHKRSQILTSYQIRESCINEGREMLDGLNSALEASECEIQQSRLIDNFSRMAEKTRNMLESACLKLEAEAKYIQDLDSGKYPIPNDVMDQAESESKKMGMKAATLELKALLKSRKIGIDQFVDFTVPLLETFFDDHIFRELKLAADK